MGKQRGHRRRIARALDTAETLLNSPNVPENKERAETLLRDAYLDYQKKYPWTPRLASDPLFVRGMNLMARFDMVFPIQPETAITPLENIHARLDEIEVRLDTIEGDDKHREGQKIHTAFRGLTASIRHHEIALGRTPETARARERLHALIGRTLVEVFDVEPTKED